MTRAMLLFVLLAPMLAVVRAQPQPIDAPGPAIILLANQADLRFAAASSSKAQRTAGVWQALRRHAQRRQAPILQLLGRRGIQAHSFTVVNAIAADLDAATAALLMTRPEVARIIADTPQKRLDLPQHTSRPPQPSAAQAIQPGIIDIKADQVWSSYGVTGTGVVVASNDTGVYWQHPALRRQYRGWDGDSADHNYNWHDAIHSEVSGNGSNPCGFDSSEPCDDYMTGHGTHTTGTMVGDDGGEQRIGVAPGARWIACRNMEQGYGTTASYLECFDWFLAPTDLQGQNPRPELAPDIVNNSWSCLRSEGCTEGQLAVLEPAVQSLSAAGILVVSAAGNSGPDCSTINTPPAIYPDSLSAGAYSAGTGAIASFSSRGPVHYGGHTRSGPDLSAPGVDVYSSTRSGDYFYLSGTSMAAPHVTGAAALLIAANPALRGKVEQIKHILKLSARPAYIAENVCHSGPEDRPNTVYGWGKLDALEAVESRRHGTLSITVTSSLSEQLHKKVNIDITAPISVSTTTSAIERGRAWLLLPAGTYTVKASDQLPGVTQGTAGIVEMATTSLTLSLPRDYQWLPGMHR